MRWCVFFLLSGGCDRVFDLREVETDVDASTDGIRVDGASADGVQPCKLSVWGPTVPLGIVDATDAQISDDGTELYVTQTTSGHSDLYVTKRVGLGQDFPARSGLTAFNTTFSETDAATSADGLHLVFVSNRTGANAVFQSSRASRIDSWSSPVEVDGIAFGFAAGIDLSPDGRRLVISEGAGPGRVLYEMQRASPTAALTTIRTVASSQSVGFPSVSGDGLTLYFHTYVNNVFALWTMTRADLDSEFDPATKTLFAADASDADISADDLTIVYRAQGLGLVTRTRTCD